MKGRRRAKPLVRQEEVAKATNLQHEQIRGMVSNQENVAEYLRTLADQCADDPNVHSEVVKSAVLLRLFLEKQSKAARAQFPDVFKVDGE